MGRTIAALGRLARQHTGIPEPLAGDLVMPDAPVSENPTDAVATPSASSQKSKKKKKGKGGRL